jgi:hypothetical protein
MLFLGSIKDFMEIRRSAGFRRNLPKIRAHTNIQGNDIVDAAAKLAVKDFDTRPPTKSFELMSKR